MSSAAEEAGFDEPGTDAAQVAAGYATVTALRRICGRDDVDLSGLAASTI